MAQLKTKIKLYLEANSKTYNGERRNIALQDDGSGAYIRSWGVSGLAEPTAEQLTSYDSAGDTEESNNLVRAARKIAYGDIGDQLDEIFKDIDVWKARIQAIKDANPKS
jgi:hypothetical protein|tara:strand:- start:22 stop:348 length:327 start_codon:yes stop_codon:yes gene_type:complete